MITKATLKKVEQISNNEEAAVALFNDNFAIIEDVFKDYVSRTGRVPTEMKHSLDMGSQRIINLGKPTGDNDAVRYKDVRQALEETKKVADYAESAHAYSKEAASHVGTAKGFAMQAKSSEEAAEDSAERAQKTADEVFANIDSSQQAAAAAANSAAVAKGHADAASASAKEAKDSSTLATQAASTATAAAATAEEAANNAEADAQNALESMEHAMASEEQAKQFATVSSEKAEEALASAEEALASAEEALASAEEAQRIKDSLGSVYIFKGSVPTFSQLPSNAEVGDVYDVIDSGVNYAWTGSQWDSLGASVDMSLYATKEYVDTTEQEIITDFMDADTALQTQITGISGVLAEEQNKIEAIEGKIPTNASSSNLLSTATDLLNATQKVRSDFAEADSELQTQINGQATAIAGKQDKLTAGENIKIENNVISATGGSSVSSLSDIAIAGDNIVFTDDSSGKKQISASLSSYVQNKTTKSRALAIGVSPYGDVSGSGSVSIGTAKATQQNALAIGADYRGASNVTQASGYRSIAIGTCYDTQGAAVASGNDSIAIGTRYTQASGSSGVAIGFGTTASGNNSALAIGAGAIASAAYTSSYGASAEAAGERAVAVGYYAKASAKNAVQLGTGTNANEATLQFRGYQLVNNEGNIPADRITANLSRSLMETAQAGEGINIAINPVQNFTTVGTAVTVSDEYVASGFTGSSYLTTPMPLSGKESDSWEIGVAFVVSSLSSQQLIFRGINSDNSLAAQMRVNTSGTIFFGAGAASLTSSTAFSTGSKVHVKVVYDASTSTYTMHTSTDGVTWSQQATKSAAAVTSLGSTINLGQNGTALNLYLKNCYMSSSGTEVWRAVQGADKVQLGLNKSEVSMLGMPSNKSVELTLGASDTNYTAPANGWFSVSGAGNSAGQFVYLATANNGVMRDRIIVAANGYINGFIPCKKGDYVRVQYNTNNKPSLFFIYAEGDK